MQGMKMKIGIVVEPVPCRQHETSFEPAAAVATNGLALLSHFSKTDSSLFLPVIHQEPWLKR